MTLLLDSTALVALLVDAPARVVVLAAMRDDAEWCAAAHALPESLAALDRLDVEDRDGLEDELRRLWDYVAVVPLDQGCVEEAGRLMRRSPMRTTDALHLAAGSRLPRPVRLVTLDAAQIALAAPLGFEVVSP